MILCGTATFEIMRSTGMKGYKKFSAIVLKNFIQLVNGILQIFIRMTGSELLIVLIFALMKEMNNGSANTVMHVQTGNINMFMTVVIFCSTIIREHIA